MCVCESYILIYMYLIEIRLFPSAFTVQFLPIAMHSSKLIIILDLTNNLVLHHRLLISQSKTIRYRCKVFGVQFMKYYRLRL